MSTGIWGGQKRASDIPRNEGNDYCELLDVDAVNQTQVL